jgi:hypothetical protein
VTETAPDYLRTTSAAMTDRYTAADCVTHAMAVAERLHAAGRAPWIGRIRHVTTRGEDLFHEPLIPLRFRSSCWNTHYVCCCDGNAYDPILGQPVRLPDYTRAVFGHEIDVAEHLSPEETARLAREGKLWEAFRPQPLRAPGAQSPPTRR